VYTVAEIRRMLEAASLSVVSMYSTFDKRPYEFGSPRLPITAQRL
jgi:hypothetical protein